MSSEQTADLTVTSFNRLVFVMETDCVPCEVRYTGADKSLARPTSRCILFDGENISFDASIVLYIVLIFLQL
jgi:hypothetical protein